MVIMFEGMDNCLKDTTINLLRKFLIAETHIVKCSSPPNHIENKEQYQKYHFTDMFRLIELVSNDNRNVLFNRSHLGEYVYSQIYRGYNGNWIFDLEQDFINRQPTIKTLLVLLYDSDNESLKNRDDGKSLSQVEDAKLDLERTLFLKAYNMSYIKNKLKFNLSTIPLIDNGKLDLLVIIREILNVIKEI